MRALPLPPTHLSSTVLQVPYGITLPPPPFRSFINLHSVMPDWEVIHPLGLGRLQSRIECSWGRTRSSRFSNLSSNPSVLASGLYSRFPRRRGRAQTVWMDADGTAKAVAGTGKASEGRSMVCYGVTRLMMEGQGLKALKESELCDVEGGGCSRIPHRIPWIGAQSWGFSVPAPKPHRADAGWEGTTVDVGVNDAAGAEAKAGL
ncbi:hypothetical protein QBC34DRAFT_398619 [Podospora aff. communis PSN243]|uniref:Uncharacterized protein n=1 Tax=Podospora aff. communis PSN243 TaxID=3040156 RepID=A0AAV9GWV6_9PEZI|nr:hypothetical protein QBC34DRAFT_398619 [Podospora aff. communis PSN243]